jgi:hypothetical protein
VLRSQDCSERWDIPIGSIHGRSITSNVGAHRGTFSGSTSLHRLAIVPVKHKLSCHSREAGSQPQRRIHLSPRALLAHNFVARRFYGLGRRPRGDCLRPIRDLACHAFDERTSQFPPLKRSAVADREKRKILEIVVTVGCFGFLRRILPTDKRRRRHQVPQDHVMVVAVQVWRWSIHWDLDIIELE